MITRESIFKNTLYLIIADGISKIFDIVSIVLLIRFLTPAEFGILTFWLSFAVIINFTTDLGIGKFFVKEIAREELKGKKFFSVILIGKLFFITITACLFLAFTLILNFNDSERTIGYIIFFALILKTLIFEVFYTVFRAFQKMQYQAVGRLISSITLITTILIVIYLNKSVIEIALAYIITYGITLTFCLIILLKKFFTPIKYFNFKLLKSIINDSIPFGLANVFNMSNAWIITFFLFYFYSNEIVGYYNAVTKLIDSITVFPVIIGTAVYPSLSKLYIENIKNFKNLFQKYLILILIISCPLNLIFLIYSKDIIFIIFGSQYKESILILQILSFYVSILFIRTTMSRFLESIDKQVLHMKISLFILIIGLILSFYLISEFGLLGASIANVSITLIGLSVYILASNRQSHKYIERNLIHSFLKILLIGLLVGFFSVIIKITILKEILIINLAILILFTLIAYFLLLIVFNIIKKEDIQEIIMFFKNTAQGEF